MLRAMTIAGAVFMGPSAGLESSARLYDTV